MAHTSIFSVPFFTLYNNGGIDDEGGRHHNACMFISIKQYLDITDSGSNISVDLLKAMLVFDSLTKPFDFEEVTLNNIKMALDMLKKKLNIWAAKKINNKWYLNNSGDPIMSITRNISDHYPLDVIARDPEINIVWYSGTGTTHFELIIDCPGIDRIPKLQDYHPIGNFPKFSRAIPYDELVDSSEVKVDDSPPVDEIGELIMKLEYIREKKKNNEMVLDALQNRKSLTDNHSSISEINQEMGAIEAANSDLDAAIADVNDAITKLSGGYQRMTGGRLSNLSLHQLAGYSSLRIHKLPGFNWS